MSFIKLKDLVLLKEMPKTGVYLDPVFKEKLERFLKIKLSNMEVFSDIEENSIGGGYYILSGHLNDILDRWGCIIKKRDDGIVLCAGSTFKQISFTGKESALQVMLTHKFETDPPKAASKLYVFLAKKWNSIIFSDGRVTDDAKNVWYELLTRPNLKNEKVSLFVWDKLTRKEITNFGNIDDLFGTDDKYENILIGIKPIK